MTVGSQDGPDSRLVHAVGRAAAQLRELSEELDLSNDELMAAIQFLGEVAAAGELVLLSDVLGLSRVVDDQTNRASSGTPSNVLGPFYVEGAPWVDNPGSIVREETAGTPLNLSGTVIDASSGAPIPGAIVDVWQADARGRYSNERDGVDPWHLRGRQRTDAGGRYLIKTLRPSHYTVKHDGPVGRLLRALGRHPWRPAHVHYRVDAPGFAPLVTQAYLAGGPYLDDDTISGVKPELIVATDDGRLAINLALEPASA